MLTIKDMEQLSARGLTMEKVDRQLNYYKTGFPYLQVISAATPQKGITVMSQSEIDAAFAAYSANKLKITKFVPASGAASRMFKDIFAAYESGIMNKQSEIFVERIRDFAFYSPELFDNCSDMEILGKVLGPEGLNYGVRPKGQILFHKYQHELRTSFEEHLVEGALYAETPDGRVDITISVSEEHLNGFRQLFYSVKDKYEKRYGVKYNINFTLQSPSTDIIAVTEDNEPFRKDDGTLLFRPGGHGALIDNINKIDSDILIIKNIDNVVKEDFIEQTVLWKKILVGRLILCKERNYIYINALNNALKLGNKSEIKMFTDDIRQYLSKMYCVDLPDVEESMLPELLLKKLDRPIRVCGMVRNLGEPGGGPFIVRDKDGSTSLQILESVQLNPDDSQTSRLFASGTHFNPVDLVCSITDEQGHKFDLSQYVDESSGFISSKSYEGRKLKAQELPGLWNGAMSDWNTVFVEVPLITFNPVKTVLDLLRKEHLGL